MMHNLDWKVIIQVAIGVALGIGLSWGVYVTGSFLLATIMIWGK